jgi:hypothetical protein
MAKRLTIPKALAFAVVSTLTLTGCDDEDDPPQECDIEGVCPADGRVCLTETTGAPCCPICPLTPGDCPVGCVLEFPPV